ncbi:MAG: ABC transporter substrate-binding protein [Bacteroidota bacterium]|nr:ABC transporter substrate-binding protein [Bacteroidota bacterium]MDP4233711.1 ABC transporter substrate-binding protein [Bacteroidota bacterium]MDP4242350.1 ABC transporter substrate-binding protein [Bacteroidota bacterium]MDP4288697.1 ABC transporter substrate-binding protein [Bacteroidota bacterium]
MKYTKNLYLYSFLAISAMAISMAGCKGSGTGPASGLSTKNAVVWYIPGDIEGLNPVITADESSNYVEGQMFERLIGQNPRTQAWIPSLASVPVESPDHLTYTFTMDPAAHWSDGKPVTAEDVIFSYKIVANPFVINAAPLRSYYSAMDSCWIPAGQPNQVVFHFNKYRYDLLKIIIYESILPKHIWDPTNLTDKFSWNDVKAETPTNPAIKQLADAFQDAGNNRDTNHMIGSGPYKYEKWITNDRVILHRDTNYWAKDRPWSDAYPDQIIFKTIKDQNAALIALKHQDIDFILNLTAPQYLTGFDSAQLKWIKKDTVYENLYSFVGWNNARPMFADKNVRKALTMLIDRDKIIHSILHDMTKKVEGPVAPTQPNYDPTAKQPSFNPDAAKKLLADAGWADHNGDGILDKVINGQKTDFRFSIEIPSGNDVSKQIALVIGNDLKSAGIIVDVTQLEPTVHLNNLRAHKFDAYLGGWVGNLSGKDGIEDEISQLWESSEAKRGGSNFVSYNDPAADKLMEAIKIEPDRAKRIDMSHQLQHIMTDDQPVTFMYSSPDRIAWLDRFDNFEFIPGRPPVNPASWIVRGSGVKRLPHAAVYSLNPAERRDPQ